MWESIKAKVGTVLEYLAFVLGFIAYFLFQRDRKLTGELEQKKAENKVSQTEGKKDEIDNEAAVSSASYEQLKSEYVGRDRHSSNSGTGPGSGSDL